MITLQVDEGALVWCAAWTTEPYQMAINYEARIKEFAPFCKDNKARQCGTFWVYDLDDLEDTTTDGVDTQASYDVTTAWKYNQDVHIILSGLTEEVNYDYIYCFAEDDEDEVNQPVGASYTDSELTNKMPYSTGVAGSQVLLTRTQIGPVKVLDESPASFTNLQMQDITAYSSKIIVTFQRSEMSQFQFWFALCIWQMEPRLCWDIQAACPA